MTEREGRDHADGGMRVAVVTETYPPEINGVALTLSRLVAGLRARGHAVSVVRPRQTSDRVSGRSPGESEDLLVQGLALPSYKEVRIGLPRPRQIRTRWLAERPDAVYVATEGPLGWSAVRAASELGIPALSGFHTNFADYARHYGFGWLASVVLAYLRALHDCTDGTLVATAEMRERLIAHGFEGVSVLARGVDCRVFSPDHRSRALRAAWGAGDGDVVALYVGRLAPEKNVPLAIEAFRAMQRRAGVQHCVIVGDGPLRTELERAHRDVVFCGLQTGEGLSMHYASADVFLFPSLTETFGNVTLEALASGLAVVAFDYAAARVHVEHGRSGALAPLGDPRAFVDAAVALAAEPARRVAVAERARARALDADWPSVVETFERLLVAAAKARRSAIAGAVAADGARTS